MGVSGRCTTGFLSFLPGRSGRGCGFGGGASAISSGGALFGYALVAVGLLAVGGRLGWSFKGDGAFWPLVLIALGAAVLWLRTRDVRNEPVALALASFSTETLVGVSLPPLTAVPLKRRDTKSFLLTRALYLRLPAAGSPRGPARRRFAPTR